MHTNFEGEIEGGVKKRIGWQVVGYAFLISAVAYFIIRTIVTF